MPSFPHNSKSTAAIQKFEPVVASQFNAHFVLMNNLQTLLGDYSFLTEYVKSVNGLFIEFSGNTIEAGFKTSKFRYDSNEKTTVYDIEVAFHNFLNSENQMFIYNALVALSRVKYNPLTGERGLKRDYADMSIVVEKFNRDGSTYWKRLTHNTFVMNDLPDQLADYQSHDIQELTVQFSADFVTDVSSDPRLTLV